MTKILFIGPPGSGKGTQSEILEKYGIKHYSSGDWVRDSTDPKIIEYRESGKYKKGILLEDNLLFGLIEKNVDKNIKYLLDGVIRTVPQAEYAKKSNLVDLVLYINVDEKTATTRILKGKRGRTDDNPKSIKKRFVEYREKTQPTIDYLSKNFEFYEIDASKSIEEVNGQVLKILGLN